MSWEIKNFIKHFSIDTAFFLALFGIFYLWHGSLSGWLTILYLSATAGFVFWYNYRKYRLAVKEYERFHGKLKAEVLDQYGNVIGHTPYQIVN